MDPFKSILVDIDATASSHPALERAILLAKGSSAKLTIADAVTVPEYARHHLPAGIEERLLEDRRQQLSRIATQVSDVPATATLLVGRPATALIKEVLRSGHDLVLRSHARDLAMSGPTGFGTIDMELLRQCPCPVLLVRQGQPAAQPRIACAIDAASEDPTAQTLNVKIVALGLSVADQLDSDSPIILHAWAPFAERTVRRYAGDDAFAAYVEGVRQWA